MTRTGKLAALIALLLTSVVCTAQGDEVKRDLKDVDDRASKPFEQYEREDAMRRLGKSGDAAAISKLIALLNDDFVNIRTSAERILGTAAGDVDKVLEAEGLTHKQAEVRRRAARVLGTRKATGATDALLRRLKGDKDDAVRAACAAALGAISDADNKEVIAGLKNALKGNDAAAGVAARQLGRMGVSDAADKIEALLKSKSPEAAVGGCDGLAALKLAGAHFEALAKAAGHKDFRVRIAAAQALATLTEIADEEAFRRLFGKLLEDDDWRVRRRSIEALVDLWLPLGAQLLIERIEAEKTALYLDIVHALEDLTGTRQGYLPQAWVSWWNGAGAKAGLAPRKNRPPQGWLHAPRGGSADEGGSGATTTYFDIPVMAQPTAFVFDMSGSMRDPVSRDNPTIRVDLSRRELGKTLKEMPADTLFNLLIYRYYSEFPIRTEVQRAFPKGVQPLNARNQDAANKWIEGQPAVGWGAFYEAILAALEDPQVQVIYFLSDGAPSRGEFIDREELVSALNEVRRFSPVTIHSVLVGGGRKDEEFMQGMAESCGGSFADARKAK